MPIWIINFGGDRGVGRGPERGRGSSKEDQKEWVPVTNLGS